MSIILSLRKIFRLDPENVIGNELADAVGLWKTAKEIAPKDVIGTCFQVEVCNIDGYYPSGDVQLHHNVAAHVLHLHF